MFRSVHTQFIIKDVNNNQFILLMDDRYSKLKKSAPACKTIVLDVLSTVYGLLNNFVENPFPITYGNFHEAFDEVI